LKKAFNSGEIVPQLLNMLLGKDSPGPQLPYLRR
jgi:hypothetical protein